MNFLKTFLLTIFILEVSLSFGQKPDTIKIEVNSHIYDTIYIKDTVVKYDTIWIEPIFDRVSLCFGGSFFKTKWRNTEPKITFGDYTRNLNMFFDVILKRKKTGVNTGLWFTSFTHNNIYDFKTQQINTITSFTVNENPYQVIDTTGFFYEYTSYDTTYYSPVFNDSITETIVDSILFFNLDTLNLIDYDTIRSINYDTIVIDTSATRINTYKYFEIPLIFRYTIIRQSRLDFDLGVGIIAGLLVKSESYYYYEPGQTVLLHNFDHKYRFLPSLWFSAGLDYRISSFLSIQVEPYYIFGLRSIYLPESASQKRPDRYGIRAGICLQF